MLIENTLPRIYNKISNVNLIISTINKNLLFFETRNICVKGEITNAGTRYNNKYWEITPACFQSFPKIKENNSGKKGQTNKDMVIEIINN